MNLRMVVVPAFLSLALASASAPAPAAVVTRNPAAISHVTTTFVPMHELTTVETTTSFPLMDGGGVPQTTPSVVGSYIAAVLAISGVPCFDCVNGKTKGTFGSGYPLGYVNTNISAMGILLEWFNVSDTAKCTVTVTLTLGGKR